jgi:hypothetical protein
MNGRMGMAVRKKSRAIISCVSKWLLMCIIQALNVESLLGLGQRFSLDLTASAVKGTFRSGK